MSNRSIAAIADAPGGAAAMDPTPRRGADEAALRSGAEILCEALVRHGVHTVFGYAGGAVLHFYDALYRHPGLYHVTVRHEQAAAHAAAGFARASGRVGVCVATSGPGATNLLTGIADAHLDSVPIVALAGQVATGLIGNDAFQETDMMAMTAAVTKHAFQPRDVSDLEEMIDAAFAIASDGRPGPVFIDLPKDVLAARTTGRARRRLHAVPERRTRESDPRAIERAAELLRKAERPVMLLGGGALSAEAGAPIRALAERLLLPVVTTINAKGVFPESHPQAHGMIGMYGRRSGIWALGEADVVLAFGCRFTDRITGKIAPFVAGKQIVHVDVDAYELGKNVPAEVAIHADARAAAESLLAATSGDAPDERRRIWARRSAVARGHCERCVPHVARSGVHPKQVMDELNRVRRSGDVVTTGVGQHQMFACHFLVHDEPRTFLTSSGLGTMGYGLPAAIGAALARPGSRVFVVDGDGSFQMTSQELATVAQERLPLVVLVLDNAQLGMVRQWQDREYDRLHAAARFDATAGHPDFAALAAAYGVAGADVTRPEDLGPALAEALRRGGPTLIRIAVDPGVDNFPMMPAGQTFADYHGNCVERPGEPFGPAEAREIAEASDA
jgi:acetolactate synthase I/II/III large subunit